MFRCAFVKFLSVAVLGTALTTVGASPIAANTLEDAAKLIILCKLTNTCPGTRQRPPKSGGGGGGGLTIEQKQQNKEVQEALNAFGFPAGYADGVIGPKGRSAIRDYQYYMNWNATGRLDSFQRDTLVTTWNKMRYGGAAAYPKMMAQEGPKGLLRTALDPTYPGVYGDPVPGQRPIHPPKPDPTIKDTDIAGGGGVIDDDLIIPDVPMKPNVVVSVAQHCELVETTSQALGAIHSANMTDPDRALNEKFCDARSFAIHNAQYVRSQAEVDDATLLRICEKIESEMALPMQRLISDGPDNVLAQAAAVNDRLRLSKGQNAMVYGQNCLGIGYRQDDAGMALASALALSASGQTPFSELIGHHVREGLGVSENAGASRPWYEQAVSALEDGHTPVFEPSSTRERIMVIRKAIEMGGLSAALGTNSEFLPTVNEIALPRN